MRQILGYLDSVNEFAARHGASVGCRGIRGALRIGEIKQALRN
jgi:hypothetical protein